MGKKSVDPFKFLRKAEYILLIAIPFLIYFFYHGNHQQKEAVDEYADKKVISLPDEDVAVVFDEKVFFMMEKMIREAKKTIFISTYTIKNNRLMKMLEKKNDEGVKVTLAYGKSKDNYRPSFSLGAVAKKYGLFHAKFIVTDSKNVLITSANLGSGSNAVNNAVFFKNAPNASEILEKEVRDAVNGKLPKRCSKGCKTEIGKIFFTPGKACVNIKAEFLKAQKKIEGAIYTVTTKNPVVTGLKNVLRKKEVPVKLIVDNWQGDGNRIVNNKAVNYFRSLGAQVKYDDKVLKKDLLFHHKFAVVDEKITVFGSLNWTSSGCYGNREIVVINKDEKIAGRFSEYFATIWKD